MAVVTVLTGGNYSKACFAVLIGFVCKGVGVLVFVMRVLLRFPINRTNFGFTDQIGFSVETVGVATFSCIVVFIRASQAAAEALIYTCVVRNACIVGIVRRGYGTVTAVVSIDTCRVSASATVNFNVTVACAIVGETIVFYTESIMRGSELSLIKSAAFRANSSSKCTLCTIGCSFNQYTKVVTRTMQAIDFSSCFQLGQREIDGSTVAGAVETNTVYVCFARLEIVGKVELAIACTVIVITALDQLILYQLIKSYVCITRGITLNDVGCRNFRSEGIIIVVGAFVIFQNCLFGFAGNFIVTLGALNSNNGNAILNGYLNITIVVVAISFFSCATVFFLSGQISDQGCLFCTRTSVFGYVNNTRNCKSTVLTCVKLGFFVVVESVGAKLDSEILSARTTVNLNVMVVTADVPIGIEEGIVGMIRTIGFRTVIAILTSDHYGNTCFTVLVCFVCKGVGVFEYVMCSLLRFPATCSNFNFANDVAFGVVAVGIAAFSYIIVITCTSDAASGTLIYLYGVSVSGIICVCITGNVVVSTVIGVGPSTLTATTAVNFNIAVACTVIGKIVVCYTVCTVAVICPFTCVITVATSFFNNNTCFTVLVVFIQECEGVIDCVVTTVL